MSNPSNKHKEVIYTTAYATAGSGAIGGFIPGFDLGGIIGGWTSMLIIIGSDSGRQLDRDTVVKFLTSVLAGAAGYLGGSKVLTYSLHLLPGLGTLGAVGVNSLLNFLYTVRLGKYIAEQMEKPEFDLDDCAKLVPEITSVIFAMPSMREMNTTWQDWSNNQQYKT